MGSTSRSLWRFYLRLAPAQACSKRLNVGIRFLKFPISFMSICSVYLLSNLFYVWLFYFLSLVIFRVYDTDCNGKVAFDDILSILRDLTGSFMTEQQRQVCALDFWCLLVYHTLQKSLDHYSKIINNLDVIPLAAWMTGHAACFSHVAFALRGHNLWVCLSEILILYKK